MLVEFGLIYRKKTSKCKVRTILRNRTFEKKIDYHIDSNALLSDECVL